MTQGLSSFLGGVLFAVGLGISGMTDANKVIGFLNLAGSWDPSLAFVMVGAIGVHLVLFRMTIRRSRPLYARRFHLPQRQGFDGRLIGGAAIFGIGWGLGGFCPGPGLTSLLGLSPAAAVFVICMSLGMLAQGGFESSSRAPVNPGRA